MGLRQPSSRPTPATETVKRDEKLWSFLHPTGPPEPPPSTLDGGLVLELNVETGVAGLVYVELQDESGAPLGGHSLAEARGTRGNYVQKVATWVGGSSLTSLAGKKVTMRVVMTDAKLFSATFKCATSTE